MPLIAPTPTPLASDGQEDCLQQFAQFLAEAERSPSERKEFLDSLLLVDSTTSRTPLATQSPDR